MQYRASEEIHCKDGIITLSFFGDENSQRFFVRLNSTGGHTLEVAIDNIGQFAGLLTAIQKVYNFALG